MSDVPYRPGLQALFDVVHRLRAPGGCPWDREQTHESLRPFMLEEAYEAVEAIDEGSDAKLLEELGDVLLQVAMHAEIAEQEGRFDAVQVSEAAAAKMVARHPHVFGDAIAHDADAVLANWERIKSQEASASGAGATSIFDRVPRALPALAWTLALQERASRVGIEEPVPRAGTVAALVAALEDRDASKRFESFGDLLFALVATGRTAGLDPEDALRAAGRRFIERMRDREGVVEPSKPAGRS